MATMADYLEIQFLDSYGKARLSINLKLKRVVRHNLG